VLDGSGTPPSTGIPSDYNRGIIETVTGHTGQLTRALKIENIKPNPNECCQQVGFGASLMDLNSQVSRNYYLKQWVRLDPYLQRNADAIGGQYWRSFWAYKTYTRNRLQIQIHNHQPPGVHWYVQSDNCGARSTNCGATKYWTETSSVKVPRDQWFLVEIFYHRAPDSTGRFFFSVNGQVIFDHLGPTMPEPWEEVNNMVHASIYTANKIPGYTLVDDIEVRSAPPCGRLPCGP
jgi:hypothetical protein